ncbi:MAG TPA: four helix bundle protein [Vicinamibacterales bacterium]|nr:four helix bundle protein [Vicinamibacterales bacterium]
MARREPSIKAPYSNLVAWQRADDLFIEVHRMTLEKFPPHEKYELGGQLRRSGYSVPANIVEGNSRKSPRESGFFFNIACGSLSEVGYGLHAAKRLGYIDQQTYDRLDLLVRQTAAPLHGLLRRVRFGKLMLSQGATIIGWVLLVSELL